MISFQCYHPFHINFHIECSISTSLEHTFQFTSPPKFSSHTIELTFKYIFLASAWILYRLELLDHKEPTDPKRQWVGAYLILKHVCKNAVVGLPHKIKQSLLAIQLITRPSTKSHDWIHCRCAFSSALPTKASDLVFETDIYTYATTQASGHRSPWVRILEQFVPIIFGGPVF